MPAMASLAPPPSTLRPAPARAPDAAPRPAVATPPLNAEDVLREHGPMLARIAGSYESEPARLCKRRIDAVPTDSPAAPCRRGSVSR